MSIWSIQLKWSLDLYALKMPLNKRKYIFNRLAATITITMPIDDGGLWLVWNSHSMNQFYWSPHLHTRTDYNFILLHNIISFIEFEFMHWNFSFSAIFLCSTLFYSLRERKPANSDCIISVRYAELVDVCALASCHVSNRAHNFGAANRTDDNCACHIRGPNYRAVPWLKTQ